jgi:hypothetical protein
MRGRRSKSESTLGQCAPAGSNQGLGHNPSAAEPVVECGSPVDERFPNLVRKVDSCRGHLASRYALGHALEVGRLGRSRRQARDQRTKAASANSTTVEP